MVASGGMDFQWTVPPSAQMGEKVRRAAQKIGPLVLGVMTKIAAMCREYAKANAPWTDRTGAARAGLSVDVSNAAGAIAMTLFHTVYYGIFLELKFGGRDAIIMPTLQAHYAIAMSLLTKVFRDLFG